MNENSKPSEDVGLYAKFLQWVQAELKKEQNNSQKRLLLSLLWCLVVPFVLSFIWSLLIGLKVIDPRFRGVIDLFIVGFPALFLAFIIGQELLSAFPRVRAGVQLKGAFLRNYENAVWRNMVSNRLVKDLPFSVNQWNWIGQQYRIDLKISRERVRYLIGLGGAVFFMLTRGLDLLNADPESFELSWASVFPQLFPLLLFLVVLYLSGMQFVMTLERFESCLEEVIRQKGVN